MEPIALQRARSDTLSRPVCLRLAIQNGLGPLTEFHVGQQNDGTELRVTLPHGCAFSF